MGVPGLSKPTGLPQYVLVNLRLSLVEVHTQPNPTGATYGAKTTIGRGQTLQLNLGDDQTLAVQAEELLP